MKLYAFNFRSISTLPLAVIRQMNGGEFLARTLSILGRAAMIASVVSAPLALPPVKTNAATCAEISAFRSISRSRMFLSRVRTIQPSFASNDEPLDVADIVAKPILVSNDDQAAGSQRSGEVIPVD